MDKNKEKQIALKIYSEPEYTYLGNNNERPDFIITKDNIKFGVEVTGFYYNLSSARLQNQKNYFNRLIKNPTLDSSYIHKDDKKNLLPSKLYCRANQNEKYKHWLDCILLKTDYSDIPGEKPSFSFFENKIIDIINAKNLKSIKYDNSLNYIELIINDTESFFSGLNDENIKEIFNSPNLLAVVEKSNFYRVYIVSKKDNDDLVYVLGKNINNLYDNNIFSK